MWFSSQKILSYNKTLNFVVSNRGGGKTIEGMRLITKTYLKNGLTSIWLRRFDVEMDEVFFTKYFTDPVFLDMFPEYEFKCKKHKVGGTGYIRKKGCDAWLPYIQFMSLSTALKHKSVPFTTTKYIIFDEFIIDDKKSNLHYLKNEVFIFFEFLQSVMRLRENVRVIFNGNSISIINPYFIHYNVKRLKQEITIQNEIAIQYFKDNEYTEIMRNSRFGRLVNNTDYGKYAIDNEFYRDKPIFVEKKPNTAHYWYGIKYEERIISVWQDRKSHQYYICNAYDENRPLFTLTSDDHTINTILISNIHKCFPLECLLQMYDLGKVRFDDINIQSIFYDILYLLGR